MDCDESIDRGNKRKSPNDLILFHDVHIPVNPKGYDDE